MAFCNRCGTKIPDNVFVCGNCSGLGNSPAVQLPSGVVMVSAQPARRSLLKPTLWIVAGLVAAFAVFTVMGITKAAQDGIREGVTKNIGHTEDIKAIQAVLKQDGVLTEAMNRAINDTKIKSADDFDKVAELMNGYIKDARQIDTRFCPRDFAEAYYRHLSAYANEADAVASHPHVPTGDEAFANGFFRGLAGDATGGAVQIQDELKDWYRQVKDGDAEVRKSWQEVEALAVRYGA